MKLIFTLLIILFGVAAFLHKRVSDNAAGKIFGNMTYHIDDALDKKNITLVNGEHEEWELRVEYDNRYVFGDFNHDGLKDVAVMIIENTGGNQDWYTLAFLINDGKRLAHKATIYLDDRAIINSMRAKNDKVSIDMYVHQAGDSMGGPSKRVKELYEYPGPNTFVSRKQMLENSQTPPRRF